MTSKNFMPQKILVKKSSDQLIFVFVPTFRIYQIQFGRLPVVSSDKKTYIANRQNWQSCCPVESSMNVVVAKT